MLNAPPTKQISANMDSAITHATNAEECGSKTMMESRSLSENLWPSAAWNQANNNQ